MTSPNQALMAQMTACRVCAAHLPLGPKPIVRVSSAQARIVIISQAPGTRAHVSGVPWDDASGVRLRAWMGLEAVQFYNEDVVAILPMGFCYPGKSAGGDAPPRPECAPIWHDHALALLPHRQLTLLIGAYANARYLGKARAATLGQTVQNWREHVRSGFFPLVHPSPRNQSWRRANPWYEKEIIPELQNQIAIALSR
jgi:uracil-DNA glycosylase